MKIRDWYLGINRKKQSNKWMARLWYSSISHSLGSFSSLKEAVRVVDEEILRIRGNNAITNAKMIEDGILPQIIENLDNLKFDVDDLPNEIWKDVVGFENLYRVSHLGRIKSCKYRYKGEKYEIILKARPCTKGYLRISLCQNGKIFSKSVHKLVAEAFIPNLKNLPQVHHIDYNKSNNTVENLMWITNDDNMKDAVEKGVFRNRPSPNRHLTNEQVKKIRELYKNDGLTMTKIAEMFNISINSISSIIQKKSYLNIV